MPFDAGRTGTDNLELLAQDLEKTDTFKLTTYSHPCGSPACVAGHAVYRWKDLQVESSRCALLQPDFEEFAERIGVSYKGLRELCLPQVKLYVGKLTHISPGPEGKRVASKYVTGKMAAAALRRLRDTGEAYFDPADA